MKSGMTNGRVAIRMRKSKDGSTKLGVFKMIRRRRAGEAVVFFILAIFIAFNAGATPPPPEVLEAAQAGLPTFMELIPAGETANFGFAPEENLEKASLGSPFEVYTIKPEALSAYRTGETVSSLISSTGVWYFPVMMNGEMRVILTVEWMEGRWQAVGIGSAALAGELQRVINRWPRAKGYEPLIVKVFQAKEYLFTIPQADDYNLNPFVFADRRREGDYSTLTGLPTAAARLRAAVAENPQRGF